MFLLWADLFPGEVAFPDFQTAPLSSTCSSHKILIFQNVNKAHGHAIASLRDEIYVYTYIRKVKKLESKHQSA